MERCRSSPKRFLLPGGCFANRADSVNRFRVRLPSTMETEPELVHRVSIRRASDDGSIAELGIESVVIPLEADAELHTHEGRESIHQIARDLQSPRASMRKPQRGVDGPGVDHEEIREPEVGEKLI